MSDRFLYTVYEVQWVKFEGPFTMPYKCPAALLFKYYSASYFDDELTMANSLQTYKVFTVKFSELN